MMYCAYCKKPLSGTKQTPHTILHEKCFEELFEFKWMYEDLCK